MSPLKKRRQKQKKPSQKSQPRRKYHQTHGRVRIVQCEMMIHVLWSLPNTAFLDLEKIAVKMALNLAGSCEYSSPVPMVNNGLTSAQRIHLHLHMMKSKKKTSLDSHSSTYLSWQLVSQLFLPLTDWTIWTQPQCVAECLAAGSCNQMPKAHIFEKNMCLFHACAAI